MWNKELFVARYCLGAKRIFSELHEQPFVVELDLRGIYQQGLSSAPAFL
jgi:hypothetical protein